VAFRLAGPESPGFLGIGGGLVGFGARRVREPSGIPSAPVQRAALSASTSRRTLSPGTKTPASLSGAGAVRPSRKWSGRQGLEGVVERDSAGRGPFRGRSASEPPT
jgi:hypothetical protein